MNINAASGHKVRYTGCSDAQVTYGGHDDPRGLLTVGQVYEVHHTEVHSFRTDVYLVGFEDKDFNSVCFEDAEPGGEPERYNTGGFGAGMHKSHKGEWVRYEDYDSLRAANAELREQISKVESLLGVPDERSKHLVGKLNVVLSRMQREADTERGARSVAEQQVAELRARNEAMAGLLEEAESYVKHSANCLIAPFAQQVGANDLCQRIDALKERTPS